MLCERLGELLSFFDLTITQFTKRIGLSNAYGSQLLSGKADNPSESVYHRIASEFHVNIDWLKTGQGSMFEGDAALTRAASFVKGYYDMPEDVRNAISLIMEYSKYRRLYEELKEKSAEAMTIMDKYKAGELVEKGGCPKDKA